MPKTRTNTSRLAQTAYEAVRDAIEHGELAPGDRVSEYKTADWLKISRTPAREGLLRLESEGLLAHHPRRGLIVASIDGEALKEVFVAREVLEGSLSRLAARNGSGPELDAIMRCIEIEPSLLDDREAMYSNNKKFHKLIRKAAHNRYMAKYVGTLDDVVAADRRGSSLVDRQRRDAVIREHELLAKAIFSRDADAAEESARAHIRAAYEARLRVGWPDSE